MSTNPTTTAPHSADPLVEPFEVLKVTDTRAYIEDDDRWIPVAGSGDAHECERCGKLHEVHATIKDATGRVAVVGVGCMNATKPEARRLANSAASEARRAAVEAARAAAVAELDRIEAELPEFPAEDVVRSVAADGDLFAGRPMWAVADVRCFGFDDSDDAERVRCLRTSWTRKRAAEGAGGSDNLTRLERLADRVIGW